MRNFFLKNLPAFILVFIAIIYLVGVTDLSYILNIPMKMHIATANAASVSGGLDFSRNTLISGNSTDSVNNHNFKKNPYLVCLECQNIPTAYESKIFVIYKLFTYIPFIKRPYYIHLVYNISHPPKSIFL